MLEWEVKLGHVLRKESMCTVWARSSYGWICASYFCVVGSARTRLMAETLPLRKTRYFGFSLVWLPSRACGYFRVQRPWGTARCCGRTETERDDGTHAKSLKLWQGDFTATVRHTWDLSSMVQSGSFADAIVLFLSLSHFFQPVCFVFLWICVKHGKGVYVCV